ncbi:unnamed protein product [Protopolystoma xenopodis]|uniref:Uncharacterized protein n=1 Tax=Protopolystoma xenopodis TaxID=117903 RepID=A0A448WSA2_9PLAT|nr:unnamed protein product [Protopolystoma xenopodis]
MLVVPADKLWTDVHRRSIPNKQIAENQASSSILRREAGRQLNKTHPPDGFKLKTPNNHMSCREKERRLSAGSVTDRSLMGRYSYDMYIISQDCVASTSPEAVSIGQLELVPSGPRARHLAVRSTVFSAC